MQLLEISSRKDESSFAKANVLAVQIVIMTLEVHACIMESREVLENFGVLNGDAILSSKNGGLEHGSVENGIEQFVCFEKGEGNLADEVLEDLEEYWEDINDRLIISRMVSDSVIKGMVTAVEQAAEERIATKEIEVANLKECLQSRVADTTTLEVIRLPMVQNEYNGQNYGRFSSFTDLCVKHDKMREALHGFSNVARKQFKQVEKQIRCKGGSNSIKKIGSGVELVGLSGILQEKESNCSQHLDKTLEFLKTTVDITCMQVDDLILSSKMSLCEWRQEQDLLGKLEDIVMQSVIKSLHEESEEKLWEQNAQFYGSSYSKWLERVNEIGSLGCQLDAIVKSLSITEAGLVLHGSHDLDHLHRKAFSNHATLPTSLCEGNGKLEASKTDVPESYDFLQLKHMSKEELVKYFNSIITEMRRNHESALQQKTEENFSLKREYLKERGSYVTHRQDEEFEVLRKKIPEVITKLDDFLMENERFPVLINQANCLVKLKGRLENLLSENRQLRHSLAEKENELKCLEVQVDDNAKKLLQHSMTEANMLKLVADLKSSVEDLCIDASLTEEVHKCAMKELIAQMNHNSEDSNMEFPIMPNNCDNILSEASLPAETTSRCEIDDSDIELLILQGLSGLIFGEAMKDAEEKFKDLYQENLTENEIRNSLQIKVLEKEKELKLEFDEKERLKERILNLDKAMEQKEKLAMDLSISLSKEREQFELASQQISSLREHANQQQAVVSASNTIRAQLIEVMEQMEVDKVEMHNLIQKLDQTKEELTEAIEKRNIALTLAQERHDKLLLHEASEEELKKEMKMVIFNVYGLSKMLDDVECRISGTIRKNNLRLEDASSQLKSLTEAANVLRRTGQTYRQKLDRRCADLQKAEAEVDLLGDEVDALLILLEKIYIALDHYSPILKHYPGIIEILELVRRELSGESIKLLQ